MNEYSLSLFFSSFWLFFALIFINNKEMFYRIFIYWLLSPNRFNMSFKQNFSPNISLVWHLGVFFKYIIHIESALSIDVFEILIHNS